MHGAYRRVGKTDTAYYHRDLQYDLIGLSMWTDPADTQRNIDWTQRLFAAWEPHLARAVYVNDLGDEGEDRARSAYGDNYPRLVALKNKYDPTNLFRSIKTSNRWFDRLDRFRQSTRQPSELCAPPGGRCAGVDPASTANLERLNSRSHQPNCHLNTPENPRDAHAEPS